MQRRVVLVLLVLGAAAAFSLPQASFAQAQPPRSRRSQRVHMQAVQVAGPDGKIKFTVLPNAERLTFTVTMGNTIVIEPSPIVMDLDGYDLSSGVVFNNSERYSIDESYPWYGAHATAINQCNGAKLSLTHDLSFTSYILEIRVFNDGVAYRHVIPGEENASRAPDEYSAFVIPNDSTLWYGGLADGHYETEFVKKNISEVHAGEWAGPPLTFKLPLDAGYASITEANLVNYSGMGLEADGRHGWIIGLGHRHPLNWPFELRYGRDEAKRLGKPASIAGTATTPWRVVMLGPDLNTLVNSTILTNLCPSPDPKLFAEGIRTSWIKPGRAVWRYLDGGPAGMDGMKEFFKMVHDLGVTGAKIDFFDHEAKEVIDLYEALLEKAAEYQILVVFHGANKPTGRQRAWPNELVREAIRGMESSALKERARHETILPFTRLLAGPADYTAMLFNDRRRDTTVVHQIASMVVFAAPLLTIAANPQTILNKPAGQVIESVPPVWDETIVLPDSAIGELAAYARRKGNTWFLAVMCGPQAKTISVPLSFLGDGQYRSVQVHDSPADNTKVEIENSIHERNDSLTIELQAGGGFLGRFSKSQ